MQGIQDPNAGPRLPAAANARPRSVLFADDDVVLRPLVRASLAKLGFTVTLAADGLAAMAAARATTFDLVLLDVQMPGASGFEVCRALRALPQYRLTPVLMATGLNDHASIEAAFDAGASDFIRKPLNLPLLNHRVRFLMKAAETLGELEDKRARLDEALDLARLIHWDYDPGSGLLRATDGGYQGIGLSKGSFTIPEMLSRIHTDDRALAIARFRSVLGGADCASYDHRILGADGDERHVHVTLRAHRGPDGALQRISGSAQDITELKRSQARLDYLARHDPLTGLPNRAALAQHLEECIERDGAAGRATGVLYVDLDRFKNVNDSLGHPFGDRLLRAIVERLRGVVPAARMLARIGGDEFVAVLDAMTGEPDAEALARAVLDRLQEPFRLDQYEFVIGASIGVCTFPLHGQTVDELIRNADTAMYRAKEQGRNQYRVYNERMSADILERLSLEADLRMAVARDELRLFYQPKIDLDSGRILGAEALIRWQHPVRGMVSPGAFIPIAEDSGLIADIGQWVIEQAARDASRWCTPAFALQDIAVNVAGAQIWRSDFLDHMRRTLAASGIPASALQVEITETLVMSDATREDTLRRLNALRGLGITMAIDDFGTGHSSLAYLKQLPVSILKIDQSFVGHLGHDPNDEAIVRAIIALAGSLQLKLVAEGVETFEQAAWLREAGVHLGQGYLFSRPVPAAEFEALLQAQQQALRAAAHARG